MEKDHEDIAGQKRFPAAAAPLATDMVGAFTVRATNYFARGDVQVNRATSSTCAGCSRPRRRGAKGSTRTARPSTRRRGRATGITSSAARYTSDLEQTARRT